LTEPEILDIFSRLIQIKSGGVIERYGFNDFLAIAREIRERVTDDVWLEVGWEILEGIGLEEFYGCDYDILVALEHIPPESALIDIQTFLRHSLVETLLEQFESGGTTVLLDVAKMVGTPAAALIPKIIELRKQEIEETIVTINGKELVLYDVYMKEVGQTTLPEESVYLEPLWFTAYGFQILTALGLGLRTTLQGLEKIQQTMSKLGVKVKVTTDGQSSGYAKSRMSDAMREILLKRSIRQPNVVRKNGART
jgi:hypothetical protein